MDLSGLTLLIREISGTFVWVVANLVYLDKRRRGRRGFARLIAFWLGMPATWLTLFLVQDAEDVRVRPPPDDEEALLREVRRDRALRDGSDEES